MNPFFFGPPARRLYGVYHPPAIAQGTSLQVLFCPPFGQEAVRTHRLHRLLADQLSRLGVHVLRFDYFGTGESMGEDEDGTLMQWRDDILVANEELRRRTRARQTVWLGTRLGATLAMMASELVDQAPDRLILWEPVLDGPVYLKELGEAHAKETFEPFIHAQPPSSDVRNEILGFGVSELWREQLLAVSPDTLNPAFKDACLCLTHLGSAATDHRWRHLSTEVEMAWHTEEAGGSALAPPALLRRLVAATLGESA